MVFATAHVRGGGELGPDWHREGRGIRKINGINDFLAVTEHLISTRIAEPGFITAYGSSAGGLITAAAANMRPELFRNLIMEAPFLAVSSIMLDPDFAHTLREYEEWGNPQNSQELENIKRYSPYDNLRSARYPAVLILHNRHDQIIPLSQSLCWIKHLRRLRQGAAPSILLIGEGGTHARWADSQSEVEAEAVKFAFALRDH